ncbi:MAG TPA: DinB family protein [Vicinamibacterales bacterium]|nr:DinB family protein [Vicinamibacterales bacterium]
MTPDQAKAAAEMLATLWEGEFPATCAVLAAVKDEKRDYKPDAKSRTAWQLATHIATADLWFIESITAGKFDFDPEKFKAQEAGFSTIEDVVAFYKKNFPGKLRALAAMPADRMSENIDFFSKMNLSRAAWIGFANNHSIHHRGQLAAYLRAMGSKVPSIYGPSADVEG